MQRFFLHGLILLGTFLSADSAIPTACILAHESNSTHSTLYIKPKATLKNYFSQRDDMCEGTESKSCTNAFESVRNLQIALNQDKKLDVNLTEDGKWGAKTKHAVELYQKNYDLLPVDGWVGKKVKISLDETAKNVKFPIDYFSRHDDMCEAREEHRCTNDYNAVRNLQIALNNDKALDINLTVDGKWGEATKEAVIVYQKNYHLQPLDGWVGKEVKKSLDKTSAGIVFPKEKIVEARASSFKDFKSFKKAINLRKSFEIFKSSKLLRQSTRNNTKIKINVATQRLSLLVNGKVALSSPCTTGAKRKFEPNSKTYRDKHTPKGNFRVLEKIRDKRSNIFGNYYRNGKRVYHGDKRKYRGSRVGVRYVGASLKYWMRLTGGGIGMHESKYIKRHPGTNGCIRLPHRVAKIVFSKVSVGTRVHIR